MLKKSIKRMLGLLALYAIFIVGIFVLQFRSGSIIRKNIRGLRVTLSQAENSGQEAALKNSFQAAFNGLVFSGDDKNPVFYESDSGLEEPVRLLSCEEPDPLSIELVFSDGVRLVFSVDESGESEALSVYADMPSDASFVSVNFSAGAGFSLEERDGRSAVFAGKANSYSLAAPALSESRIAFQKDARSARYSVVTEQVELSADDAGELALASKEIYERSLSALPREIIEKFLSAAQGEPGFFNSVSEQTVVSFVAAMAQAGRYNEALGAVPETFSKGSRRTYMSAPFFGSMADTLPSLTMQVENLNNMIARAVQERSLDIWALDNLAPYMYTQGNRGNVALLDALPASLTELNLTVAQAAGILRSWAYFNEQNSSLAKPLEPVLELCAQKIVQALSLDGQRAQLSENDSPLSVLQTAAAGDALAVYGQESGQESFENCGYLIVNSCAGDAASIDLRTLCELYPILVHSNSYYPHYLLLKTMEGPNVWAWTAAQDVRYSRDENLTVSLNVEFPVGLSHYMFVRGIAPFLRVQIYNMNFRTDPRFEIYNSSGYVYRAAAQTLLLKTRQRERNEVVRIFYRDVSEEEGEGASEE